MKEETKLRKQGASYITTFPKSLTKLLELQGDEKIEWEYDLEKNDKSLTLRIIKE